MAGHDVFISYSRDDRSAARHFAKCLAGEGLSVWWDAALHSGETFDEVIERELKAASAAVVLWSPRSVTSRWVRAEATLADRHRKLVPVIIESCDRPIIFELTHTTDLADWTGDPADTRWKTLVEDVRRLVANDSRKPPASAAPDIQPSDSERSRPSEIPATPFRASRETPPPADRRQSTNSHPHIDDSQATQFYTGADRADIYHCLEIDDGERSSKRFIVRPPGLKIGRAPPADIVLSDRQVSRTHCVVEFASGGLRVSDLDSTNGTYIDGKRITGSAMLDVGSVLRVGTVALKHQIRVAGSLEDSGFSVA
ncbi:MAG: TIR domain-containing protein [Sphingomicrobium sp.]